MKIEALPACLSFAEWIAPNHPTLLDEWRRYNP